MSNRHTNRNKTQTRYAVHRHVDRDRLIDARWDRREDTLNLGPWLSKQEVDKNMQYRSKKKWEFLLEG